MIQKIVLILATLWAYLFVSAVAYAFDAPSFPSCVNPQGSTIANYDSGTHGVVGDPGTHNGKDSVFQVNSSQVLQCFCPPSGSGIQTNFLKTTTLNDNQIKSLVSQG